MPVAFAQLSATQGLRPASQTVVPDVIAGRVINAVTGAPISRTLVQVGGHAALTNAEGRFRFEQPAAPLTSLTVRKPGFSISPEQAEGFGAAEAINGDDPAEVTISLWPEGLLSGTVLAGDGEPLQRISVLARRSVFDEQGHHQQVSGETQTDSHGQFRLPVPAGDYVLETQYSQNAAGRGEAALPQSFPTGTSSSAGGELHVASGQQQVVEIHVTVSRTHTVTLPLDTNDEAPPRITARASNGLIFNTGFTHSPEPGTMRLNLPSGSYTLRATRFSRDGMQFGESSVIVGNGDVAAAPLHVASLPSVPVEVVTDTSAGRGTNQSGGRSTASPNVMQYNIVLQPADADPNSPIQFGVRPTQQRDGSFSLAAPPGVYRLNASGASGWYIRSATSRGTDLLQEDLVISAGSTPSPITLVVSNQTGGLQGVVKVAGTPTAAWIYLVASGPSLPSVVIRRSDGTGAYRITDLPPGGYRVIAFPFRHSENLADVSLLSRYGAHVGSVSISAGATETLNLDGVTPKELTR